MSYRPYFFIVLLIIVSIVLNINKITSTILNNASMLILMRNSCDPELSPCRNMNYFHYPVIRWEKNIKSFELAGKLIKTAYKQDKNNPGLINNLASWYFSNGDRESAARILLHHGIRLISQDTLNENGYSITLFHSKPFGENNSSFLELTSFQWEFHIIAAYQELLLRNIPEASKQFQIGISLAKGNASEQDIRDFYTTLANEQQSYVDKNWQSQLIAGKFYALAGEAVTAIELLEPIMGDDRIPDKEKAWAAYYLGMAYEDINNIILAKQSYWKGWEIDKSININGFSLLALNSDSSSGLINIDEIRSVIINNGPNFPQNADLGSLGTRVGEYKYKGASFLGFDFDDTLLSYTPVVDVYLWWDIHSSGGGFLSRDTIMTLNNTQIIHKRISNLIINPGFEWGLDQNGIPLGWESIMYESSKENVIQYMTENGNNILILNNMNNDNSGLMGPSMITEPYSVYLQYGKIIDFEFGNANIGRTCWGGEFVEGGQYFIANNILNLDRDNDGWFYISDINYAIPLEKPTRCRYILIQTMRQFSVSAFDDILFASIEIK